MKEITQPVILFDGKCILCNTSIQFIIKRDKKRVFRFASLQSEFGKTVIGEFQLKPENTDSIILLEKKNIEIKSKAVLTILKKLGGVYQTFYVLLILPAFLRDSIYDFIARHRYNWFGKRATCMIITPELKELFIESNE